MWLTCTCVPLTCSNARQVRVCVPPTCSARVEGPCGSPAPVSRSHAATLASCVRVSHPHAPEGARASLVHVWSPMPLDDPRVHPPSSCFPMAFPSSRRAPDPLTLSSAPLPPIRCWPPQLACPSSRHPAVTSTASVQASSSTAPLCTTTSPYALARSTRCCCWPTGRGRDSCRRCGTATCPSGRCQPRTGGMSPSSTRHRHSWNHFRPENCLTRECAMQEGGRRGGCLAQYVCAGG